MSKGKLDERKLMKKWLVDLQKSYPSSSFSYRIPDTPYAGYKPFDAFVLLNAVPWALEFKVNRRKTKLFDVSNEVTNHQMYELRKFARAGGRSAVVVYEASLNEWIFWEVVQ
jgi:hypothetical protein